MRESGMRRLAVALCVAVLAVGAACERTGPTRLELERDTLVLYGSQRTTLPVRRVDGTGARVSLKGLKVLPSTDSSLQVRGGALACRHAGFTDVRLVVGKLSDTLVVECRPAREVRSPFLIDMWLGDPPQSLETTAILTVGAVERIHPIRVSVSDSQVVLVRDDRIIPLAVGRSTLRANYGGVSKTIHVVVRELIARDTLVLTPGAFRTWWLAPGRYEITIAGVPTTADLRPLELAGEGIRCVPSGRSEDLMHCVVYERAALGVRFRATDTAGSVGRAAITIVKSP